MYLLEAADALVELIRAKVADAQPDPKTRIEVSPLDLAEDGPRNCIWIGEVKTDLPWRSLGDNAANRIERMVIPFFVRVYREAAGQRDAGLQARSRCGELGALIDAAVAEERDTPFEMSGTVSFGRVADFAISTKPAESGWVALGRGRLEATRYP